MSKRSKSVLSREKEALGTNLDILVWLFVGLLLWFLLLNSAHTFRMNDEASTVFFYIGLIVAIVDIIFVKRLMRIDIEFLRRHKRWNALAYFTPVPLFMIVMSWMIVIPVSNIILPYWIHVLYAHEDKMQFKVIKKRAYFMCTDEDKKWIESPDKKVDCRLVKNICVGNKYYRKHLYCTEMLSEEDWKVVQQGDDIVLKGKTSFLGIEPSAYVVLFKKEKR